MLALIVLTFAVAIAATTPTARSGTRTQLQKREHRQLASLHRYIGTLLFFRHHPQLARTTAGRRELRRARIWVAVIRRELAETRAQLRPRPSWPVPAWWVGHPSTSISPATGAWCIHEHESRDWRWGPSHHPGQTFWNHYYGGFQFVLSTWQSTFSRGEPHGWTYWHPDAASPAEQFRRAYVNWLRNGSRFGGSQWPNTSRVCGLR